MPSRTGQKALHAYVTDRAHGLWHEAARDHGISLTAVLEELAPCISDILDDYPEVVREGKFLDADRRTRRGPHR